MQSIVKAAFWKKSLNRGGYLLFVMAKVAIKSIKRLCVFVNDEHPEADALMALIDELGVEVSVAPTSGPFTLWIRDKNDNSWAYYGPTAIKRAVNAYLQ